MRLWFGQNPEKLCIVKRKLDYPKIIVGKAEGMAAGYNGHIRLTELFENCFDA